MDIRYLGITINFLNFDKECNYVTEVLTVGTYVLRYRNGMMFATYFQMIQKNTHIYTERKYGKSFN